MQYHKYTPHESLRRYIDFYWVMDTGSSYQPKKIPFFADAYTDIFVNCGSSALNFNDRSLILPGRMYMGGVATVSTYVEAFPECIFVGIRFRPGSLPMFYDIQLFEIVDQIIEFDDHHFFSLIGTDGGLPQRLDKFYISMQHKSSLIMPILDVIYHCNGIISVDDLARKCNVTKRTLERLFNTNVGIPPKEFIAITRFQQTIKLLQRERLNGRLKEVAYDMGYYDHAHFNREIKKHAGLAPTKIWPGPSFP